MIVVNERANDVILRLRLIYLILEYCIPFATLSTYAPIKITVAAAFVM